MAEHDTDPEVAGARGPIAWMARNPVASNLLMVVVLLGGLLSMLNVKQELFPQFDLDVVQVTVPYPGASPAEVEQGILLAVEEAVRGIDGVKKVTSTATEGVGGVAVELMVDADADKVLQEVKNEVDRIQTFPLDAEDPQVALASLRQEVVSLVLAGDQPLLVLHGLAEKARADLLATGEVTQVEVSGLPPLELAIEVPRERLAALGLTLDQVAAQVAAASLEVPGGAIDTTGGEILVRVSDRKRTVAEFADIVLRGTAAGAEVRLGEIATLRDGFEDSDQSTWLDGHPAVVVTAYRVGDETPSEVAAAVRAYADGLRAVLPDGVAATIWNDTSVLLRDRIDLLTRNAATGMVLVLLTLTLFLDLRLAFWVGMGIPISFMGASLLFPSFDVSVNMISLFALIVTTGIVVDDAIIVGENVYDKTQRGLGRLQAAIEGAREMAVPVTFSILTTITAFVPMLMVPGTSGKIFRVIPIVVISVLFMSLVESFFILPAHLGHGGGRVRSPTLARLLHRANAPRRHVARALERFIAGAYTPAVRRALTFRYATLGAGLALLLLSVGAVASGVVPFSFMPRTEGDMIRVEARLPYGVPVERTDGVRQELEAAFWRAADQVGLPREHVRGTLTLLGQGPRAIGPHGGGGSGSHLATVEVDLVPGDEREVSTATLYQAWQDAIPPLAGVEALEFTKDVGPSGGAAVHVQLVHTDEAVLAAASEEVARALRGYPELVNVANGYAAGKPQLDFRVEPAGRTLGLTAQDVARQIRSAFHGAEALREQRGRNELKVMVRLPEHQRVSEYDLESFEVFTPAGGPVPLEHVATFERAQAATSITREGGRRVVDVTAELGPGTVAARPVLESLQAEVLPALEARYPGLSTRFGGEQEAQQESLSALARNFALALLVMYALLAVPFRSYVQPLIIMSAIPFGFVGAVGGHVLLGYELSLISAMGIVALSGVVVNDSIVLIDAANGFRREGMGARDAIVAAGVRRFRPILLTSLTTFFGLVPMIFETSVQARFLIPMAISLGFGVMSATVIVLLLVPALYLLVEDVVGLLRALYGPPVETPATHEAPATEPAEAPRGVTSDAEGPA